MKNCSGKNCSFLFRIYFVNGTLYFSLLLLPLYLLLLLLLVVVVVEVVVVVVV